MPLYIVGDDITRMKVDAIVNPTDASCSGRGGTDAAIHAAAGMKARLEWKKLSPISAGECVMTDAGRLPCKKVIHTVGPRWTGGDRGERETLHACYRNALTLAKEAGMESVAMPLIGAGTFACPQDTVYGIAKEEICRFMETEEMEIFLLVYTKSALSMVMRECPELVRYVELTLDGDPERERYTDNDDTLRPAPLNARESRLCYSRFDEPRAKEAVSEKPEPDLFDALMPEEANFGYIERTDAAFDEREKFHSLAYAAGVFDRDLDEILKKMDIGFSEALLQLLNQKNLSNTECYKRANIDRKHFSKILSDRNYHPAKKTVLALALALRLNRDETEAFLRKAGYALSGSSRFDIIVGHAIDCGFYDVLSVNEILFRYDQELLGNISRES